MSGICAVVPSHGHYRALPGVLAALRREGLAVFVVDDGSGEPAASAIAALTGPGVTLLRHPARRGKGAAVATGLAAAGAAGFSEALQIDADGQHDTAALPRLLAAARAHPGALIAGSPRYDASAPRGRRIGRLVSRFWVAVETLSAAMPDSMCGLRVYPLAATRALLGRVPDGMAFDTAILVRLVWAGVEVVSVPVAVCYPAENFSNFAMLADNWKISRMHTALMLEWLRHVPRLLWHRPVVREER